MMGSQLLLDVRVDNGFSIMHVRIKFVAEFTGVPVSVYNENGDKIEFGIGHVEFEDLGRMLTDRLYSDRS